MLLTIFGLKSHSFPNLWPCDYSSGGIRRHLFLSRHSRLSFEHFVISSKIFLKAAQEETPPLEDLTGTVDRQAIALTKILVCPTMFVPKKTYKTKSTDQLSFGYYCTVEQQLTSRWEPGTVISATPHKDAHCVACRRWKEDLRLKLIGRPVGSKSGWVASNNKGLYLMIAPPPTSQ